jgi:rod shape-determining protein MreC
VSTLTVRQTFLLVAIFVITSLAFIQLDNRRALDPVKANLQQLLLPITRNVSDLTDRGRAQSDVEKELAAVRAERDALVAEVIKLRQENSEIQQLQEQLKVEVENPTWKPLAARVINPDPTNLQKFITIDKGSKDGIEMGMAVTDPNFYLGQVTEVWENSSRVTLIIDVSQMVGAKLADTGADGIVYGAWQKGGRLELRHIDRDSTPKEGEVVITSDLTNSQTAKVPGNIPIGKVEGPFTKDPQSDRLTVNVLPVADFDNLKVVTVILSDEG